jgi:hypothetical protein
MVRCDACGKELNYGDYPWAKCCTNPYGRAHRICFDCYSGSSCPICDSPLKSAE